MTSWLPINVDKITMFSGYSWVDLGDRCSHRCTHHAVSVVGWGPTVSLYELLECDRCGCRAWRDGRRVDIPADVSPSDQRFWEGRVEWRDVTRT